MKTVTREARSFKFFLQVSERTGQDGGGRGGGRGVLFALPVSSGLGWRGKVLGGMAPHFASLSVQYGEGLETAEDQGLLTSAVSPSPLGGWC